MFLQTLANSQVKLFTTMLTTDLGDFLKFESLKFELPSMALENKS